MKLHKGLPMCRKCALSIWSTKVKVTALITENGNWHIIAFPLHIQSWNFTHRLNISQGYARKLVISWLKTWRVWIGCRGGICPVSRFDGPIHPMADLEMFFPMNFFWWFLFRGHSRTILAWLPLWQPWAKFVIGEIPRWPPNDVLHIRNIYIFHKTWSVIHVIRGFRGQGIHFWWYYVHLILS